MRERTIERELTTLIRAAGGWCIKLTSPSMVGLPDRIILMPGGHACFAETKAPGQRLRPIQERRRCQLEALGFTVYVIDSIEQAREVAHALHSA